MCKTCWERDGAPRVATPGVLAARQAIADLYDESSVGGALHVVTDDYNTDPETVERCRQDAIQRGGFTDAEECCYGALHELTEDEILSAVSLFWGDWTLSEAT